MHVLCKWGRMHFLCKRYEHFICKYGRVHFLCNMESIFYAILKAYSMHETGIFYAALKAYAMHDWKQSIFYAESIASIFYAWIKTMRDMHATEVYMKVHILCNRGASNMYSAASNLPLGGLCNTLSSKRGHPVHIGKRYHLHVKPSGAAWTAILT